MPDENQNAAPAATEREDRIAAATEQWKAGDAGGTGGGNEVPGGTGGGTQDGASGADAAAKAAAEQAAKAAEAAKGAEPNAEEKAFIEAAGEDAKLPYFGEKRFREIYTERAEQKKQLDEFTAIFTDKANELGYTVDSTETLKGVLKDAYALYDVAAGNKPVAQLLTLFEQNWKPEQFKTVLQDLANFAASKGLKVDEKAAAEKPWEKHISDLTARLDKSDKAEKDRQEKAKADAEYKTRIDTVVTPLLNKVTELCKAAGFDPEKDKEVVEEYCDAVSAAIGRDKNKDKILEQLAKGQWGEAERVFTEYHNKLVARAKRYGDLTLAAARQKSELPKTPAGGAPPTGQGTKPAGRDLKTSEGRVAAAREEWKKSGSQ